MEGIPVVDFSALSLLVEDDDLNLEAAEATSMDMFKAFSTVGFVYLKNVGIASKSIDDINSAMRDFSSLSVESKRKYQRRSGSGNNGWIDMEQESLNPSRPGDLKEAFNVTSYGLNSEEWNPPEIARFAPLRNEFFRTCARLSQRVLRAIAIGLNLPDPAHFNQFHNTFTRPGSSTLRLLYYPLIKHDVKPNQIRLGEHTDYSSITLLFQDDVGGLQIRNRNNEWLDAAPIQDTVVVNIGDLMQRWTSDCLLSTPHRVLLNSVDPDGQKRPRQSIAFFFHPDSDTLITCLDGSCKYESIIESDFLEMKFKSTYSY